MKSELRTIKSFCKTSSQMKAFNNLVSTFARANDQFALVLWSDMSGTDLDVIPMTDETYQDLVINNGFIRGAGGMTQKLIDTFITEKEAKEYSSRNRSRLLWNI